MSLVLATILVKVVGTVFCNYHLADISSMKQQTNKQTNKKHTHTKTILARKYAPERICCKVKKFGSFYSKYQH